MIKYTDILITTLPVFGIIISGGFIRKFTWLTEEADKSLMKLIINVLLPCLVLDQLLGNPALHDTRNLIQAPLVGFCTICIGYLILIPVSRLLMKEPREQRTFVFTVGIYNYGFLPLPLAIALFDRGTTGILFIHNVGVEAALWSVGLMLLAGKGERGAWKKFLNMPLLAILVGVSLTLLGWDRFVPAPASTMLRMLGGCSIPVSLLLIGATIYDFFTPKVSGKGLRVVSYACLFRLALLPLMFIAIIVWMPCSIELKQVLALQAGMPTAVFPLVMTKHYQGDIPTALRAVLGTAVVSCFTMPLWIRWSLSLL